MTTEEHYLEGYMDDRTVGSLNEVSWGSQHGFISTLERPATGTMWYDQKTGTIYGFCDGRPQDTFSNDGVIPITICYGGLHGEDGPIAEIPSWVPKPQGALGGLETALASIKTFRERENQR